MKPIDLRDQLVNDLQQAIDLELSLIPPYLYALYSIKLPENADASTAIEKIVTHKMLHLTRVANLLNAMNKSPVLCPDSGPICLTYPCTHPLDNNRPQIALKPYSQDLLRDVLLPLEQPASAATATDPPPGPTVSTTYGGLQEAVNIHGKADDFFPGDPKVQVDNPTWTWELSDVKPIRDYASAMGAIDEIERTRIENHKLLLQVAKGSGPSGNVGLGESTSGVVSPFNAGVWPTDNPQGPEAQRAVVEFNRTYSHLLRALHSTFNGQPSLLSDAIGLMFMLKVKGRELFQVHGVGPTFEYIP